VWPIRKAWRKAAFTSDCINTTVAVALEKQPARWTITSVELDVLARVLGATQGDFIQVALNAKKHSPNSPLLKATI